MSARSVLPAVVAAGAEGVVHLGAQCLVPEAGQPAKEILNHLEEIIGGDFEKIPEDIKNKYVSKLKLIPYSSLGKQNGMLLGIKAKKLTIVKGEEKDKVEKENIILGIYDKSLTKKGEYRAIIGMEFV